jgi:UDP-glucuronate decarboxylase
MGPRNIGRDRGISLLGDNPTQDIPNWIIQLPNEQLVNFINGFWSSQNHQEKASNANSMVWYSSSEQIIEKICLIFAKFGLIANVTELEITSANPSKSYQITIPDLEPNQPLNLAHLTQKLEAPITGDMAWAQVTEIEEFAIDDYVYDFSVPEHENFIGGTYSIYCHNTYGPRMLENDGRVVSNFVVQALRGIPLTVYGEGSQTRSFCYVSDLVEGLMRLMNGDFIGPVNLGNPGEYTILELAQKVQQMVNPGAEIIFKPLPQDDPRQRQPDITRAKTYLGWEPTIPLAEGLELTINDFRERMDNI